MGGTDAVTRDHFLCPPKPLLVVRMTPLEAEKRALILQAVPDSARVDIAASPPRSRCRNAVQAGDSLPARRRGRAFDDAEFLDASVRSMKRRSS